MTHFNHYTQTMMQDSALENQTTATASVRRTSKFGAIARIALTLLIAGISLPYSIYLVLTGESSSVAHFFAKLFQEMGGALLFAFVPWILIRWSGYIFPKSFAWANKMWSAWCCLTPIGFVIKIMLWIYVLVFPFTLIAFSFAPAAWVGEYLMEAKTDWMLSLVFLIGCLLAVAITLVLDVAKLKDCKVAELLRSVFAKKEKNV